MIPRGLPGHPECESILRKTEIQNILHVNSFVFGHAIASYFAMNFFVCCRTEQIRRNIDVLGNQVCHPGKGNYNNGSGEDKEECCGFYIQFGNSDVSPSSFKKDIF